MYHLAPTASGDTAPGHVPVCAPGSLPCTAVAAPWFAPGSLAARRSPVPVPVRGLLHVGPPQSGVSGAGHVRAASWCTSCTRYTSRPCCAGPYRTRSGADRARRLYTASFCSRQHLQNALRGIPTADRPPPGQVAASRATRVLVHQPVYLGLGIVVAQADVVGRRGRVRVPVKFLYRRQTRAAVV